MARPTCWFLALIPFPLLVLLHLRIAPYTKVEESFNIQAVHDILTYGIPTENIEGTLRAHYDHFTFPGAVPRTFIGALVLAGVSRSVIWWNNEVNRQQLARIVLGLFNAFALVFYTSSIKRAFGRNTAIWYILLQASQFHVIYYASRPLPNMFAFGLATLAYSFLLPIPTSPPSFTTKRHRLSLYLLSLTSVVFRSEAALLLACHVLFLFIRSRSPSIPLRTIILPSISLGTVIGLALTVPIDTYFWQSERPLWPELSAFLFNIFPSSAYASEDPLGGAGASAWGTSPWHWYFSSALPRLLLNPLAPLLILYTFFHSFLRPRAFQHLLPPLAYIALYSFLPHKETRFILPAIPPLTLSAALSASYISLRHGMFAKILTLLLFTSTIATALLSHAVLAPLSCLSYPGGRALEALHALVPPVPPQKVHLDNLALQTGVTRFLQHRESLSRERGRAGWAYDKTGVEGEDEKKKKEWWDQFDYIVMETGGEGKALGEWEQVAVIKGLDRFRLLRLDERGGGGQGTAEVIRALYGQQVQKLWEGVIEGMFKEWALRTRLTGGRWAEVRMEEKLSIRRRKRRAVEAETVGGEGKNRLGGDW